jgi:hypothetical protein
VRPEDEAAARSVLDSLTVSPESLESVTAAEIEAESDAQFDRGGSIPAKDPAR